MKRLNTASLVAAIVASVFGASMALAQTVKPATQPGGSGGAPAKTPATSAAAGASSSDKGAATTTTATATTGASAPAVGAAATTTATAGTPSTTTPTPSGTGATTSATGAASTTTATTSTKPAAASSGQLDGSTYVVRLRDLEQRIDELKEQIRRSHTRLSLLSDTILSGGVGGARAEIAFKNDLSNAFKLTGVVFVLDGVVQYNRQDDSEAGLLESRKEIPIFSGAIPPGDHTLQVVLRLRGHGYGVFSYLRGYKFDLKSSHSFTVTEGKTIALSSVAWEKGDVTTPLEQRPAVRYESNVRTGMVDSGRPSSSSKSPVQGSVTTGPGSVSGGASIGTGAK
jgi:hypothetical protein